MFCQEWFVVEGIDLGWPTRHEELDHALCPSWKMRLLGRERIAGGGERTLLSEQTGQADAAHASTHLAQSFTPRLRAEQGLPELALMLFEFHSWQFNSLDLDQFMGAQQHLRILAPSLGVAAEKIHSSFHFSRCHRSPIETLVSGFDPRLVSFDALERLRQC